MQSKAGMCPHVEKTMKTGRNTLFVVGGKEEKGRLRTVLLVKAKRPHKMEKPSKHHATFA